MPGTSKLRFDNAVAFLFAPTSVLSMAILRIALGCSVMYQAVHKGVRVFSGAGWDNDGFIFSYQFLEWVHSFPVNASMLADCWFVSGLAFAAGLMFRVTGPLCTLLTLYQFVLSAEYYLNHEYMEIIFLLLLSLGPSHHRLSLDWLIWRFSGFAPRFHLLTLQLQTEIILIYAGLVKINSDWLQLQPLSTWLSNKQDLFFLETLWDQAWVIAVGAYGIILLHVFGAPLLFFKKTRAWVFVLYVIFHVINSRIFSIDIFPWMTIACTTLFFEPDWPRRLLARASARLGRGGAAAPAPVPELLTAARSRTTTTGVLLCAVWLVFQTLLPLRHLLYPGVVAWTGEGHRFSWQMMLAEKVCTILLFVVSDPVSQIVVIPDPGALVTRQKINRICREPDYILQFAHQTKERYQDRFGLSPDTRVQAVIMKSINYRAASLYADPLVDLGKEKVSLGHYSWIRAQQKLNKLPPPFQSYIKKSTVMDVNDLLRLTGNQGDFICRSLDAYNAFNKNEGKGRLCEQWP